VKNKKMLFQGENDLDSDEDKAQALYLPANEYVHLGQEYLLINLHIKKGTNLSLD